MTKFTNCQFSIVAPDGTPTHLTCIGDGVPMTVPVDPMNKEWAEIVEQGITPADYAAPPATWDSVRGERNQLLKDTDWQASSDRTMSDAETVYRQALRDLPAQDVGPGDVVWPSAP